jgi:hypothetical protein
MKQYISLGINILHILVRNIIIMRNIKKRMVAEVYHINDWKDVIVPRYHYYKTKE